MYLPSSAPVRAFKRAVIAAAGERFTKPLDGPVVVEITALFQRPPSHLTARGELRKGAPTHPGRNLGDVMRKATKGFPGSRWTVKAHVALGRGVTRCARAHRSLTITSLDDGGTGARNASYDQFTITSRSASRATNTARARGPASRDTSAASRRSPPSLRRYRAQYRPVRARRRR